MASKRLLLYTLLLFFSMVSPVPAAIPTPDLVIDPETHKLGKIPGGQRSHPPLELRFETTANTTEVTLSLQHQELMRPWIVEVNGRPVGELPLSYATKRLSYLSVPAGVLTNGANLLTITGDKSTTEISVGNFLLFRKSLREVLNLRRVTVSVGDGQSGKPIPARISVADAEGNGAQIFSVSSTNTAVRTGIIYSMGRPISFEIPAGTYEFYATRGMEWSLSHKTVEVSSDQTAAVDLSILHQVDTAGFIAADTHIHTLAFSGHGDSSVEERMVSLAGEGVELAVATDHNHQTDYAPYQSRLGLNSYFTPVTGNEVTTKNGHLNGFPMPPGGEVPNYQETNWVKLVEGIRLKGAKIVILNHARWRIPKDNPLTVFGFNNVSGDRFRGPAFTFDAIELVNSSAGAEIMSTPEIKSDPLELLADWFAIQNRGEKISGVGSSDSHTIDDPVGQGRTYIRSSTDTADRLNVNELCDNFLAGDTSVSYGIFADATLNQKYHMGQQVRPAGKLELTVHVAAPDWVSPRRAVVFLNGLPVAEQKLEPAPGTAFERKLRFAVAAPKHDAYLVCAVFGEPVTAPFWKTLANFTAAVTNPIYLDGDADGKYQSPRETAQKLLAATDGKLETIWQMVEKTDDALAGQMLGLLYLNREADFVHQFDSKVRANASQRKIYHRFLENSPLVSLGVKSPPAPDAEH